jgi:hypothetical protein
LALHKVSTSGLLHEWPQGSREQEIQLTHLAHAEYYLKRYRLKMLDNMSYYGDFMRAGQFKGFFQDHGQPRSPMRQLLLLLSQAAADIDKAQRGMVNWQHTNAKNLEYAEELAEMRENIKVLGIRYAKDMDTEEKFEWDGTMVDLMREDAALLVELDKRLRLVAFLMRQLKNN